MSEANSLLLSENLTEILARVYVRLAGRRFPFSY